MSRVANLALGLSKRTNDTLAGVDAVALADKFRLPAAFVARMVAEEIARRAANAA